MRIDGVGGGKVLEYGKPGLSLPGGVVGVNWRDEIVFFGNGLLVGGDGLRGGRSGFSDRFGFGCEEADDVCGFAGDEEGERSADFA
jgi:hypothetical protein